MPTPRLRLMKALSCFVLILCLNYLLELEFMIPSCSLHVLLLLLASTVSDQIATTTHKGNLPRPLHFLCRLNHYSNSINNKHSTSIGAASLYFTGVKLCDAATWCQLNYFVNSALLFIMDTCVFRISSSRLSCCNSSWLSLRAFR